MNKNHRVSTLARAVCVLLIGYLATVPSAGMVPDAQFAGPTYYDGTILTARESVLMLQMAPDYDALLFRVARDAQITRDGEKVSLEELQSGDLATLTAERGDSELLATHIAARARY